MQGVGKTRLLLVAIVAASLVPFTSRAFHTDDPLFIWIAQQITKHPLDPYGFNVNWSGFDQPMHEVMQNPPLCSYYIAAVANVFGWNEIPLHLAFLVWPVLSVLGTFAVARRFCHEPFGVALLTMFTPVFLVSATSVMCDVMMLTLWVWAIEFWLAGLERVSWWRFLASAVLISLAALTKYFAIALAPLLAVYSVARSRRLTANLFVLLIPIAVLSNYDFFTEQNYGHALFSAATSTSAAILSGTRPPHLIQLLMGLSFCGGCLFSAAFFVRLSTIRDAWKLMSITAVVFIAFAISFKFAVLSWMYNKGSQWPIWLEGGLFATAAAAFLALAAIHLINERGADALLLVLWIFGTLFFATFLNWSITSRTFLPIAPAVAILIFRHFDQRPPLDAQRLVAITAAAALSLLLATADYRQANCARSTAAVFRQNYASQADKVRFQGHGGFQYYMEEWGARPLEVRKPEWFSTEILVGRTPDYRIVQPPTERVLNRREFACPVLPLISTFSMGHGASFYSYFGGPLPWVVNEIPSESYYAIILK